MAYLEQEEKNIQGGQPTTKASFLLKIIKDG